MLNSYVRFSLPQPEPTAPEPAEGEVRVEFFGAIDQRDGGIEVFAEITECEGDAAKDIGIVPGHPKCPTGKINTFTAIRRPIWCPTNDVEDLMAVRGQGKGRAITGIAFDGLPKQFQRTLDSSPAGFIVRKGAQVSIVAGEITLRPFQRSSDFRCLQRWFNDTGDARCHVILKLENIFEQTIEAVSPEMRAVFGFDQLAGNAHSVAGLAHGALKHVADA